MSGIIALLFLISCTNVETSPDTSLLWKISGNGLKKTSYLFGTHHLVPISFLDSVPEVVTAFEVTEQTVGELDMSNMAAMQMQIMGAAMMPQGVTYESLLPPEEVQLIDSTLTDLLGMGLNQLGQLKPAMLSNLISITLYQKFYPDMTGEENIDLHFQQEAMKRSRPVVALETAEDQIEVLLNSGTLERQAELLACMVKHPELLKDQMDELQRAYYAQDVGALQALYEKEVPNDPCPSTEEEKNALNKDRNEKWLAQLPAIMEESASFVAVGAMHLPGDDGLIKGLRDLGYTVQAVR